MLVDNEVATLYLQKYARMLSYFAKLICSKCPNAEYEEIRQILSIKLISIIKTYKVGSCKESSYFYKILERESRSIIKANYSQKNLPFLNTIDTTALFSKTHFNENIDVEELSLNDFNNGNLNPDDYFKEKNLIEIIDDFASKLIEIDRKIFLLYLEGMQAKDISKKLDIDVRNVYKRIAFLKKNFAQRLKLID